MRRALLALTVLVGGSAGVAYADYVRFTYTPNVAKRQADPQPNPNAAAMGQQPGLPGPQGAAGGGGAPQRRLGPAGDTPGAPNAPPGGGGGPAMMQQMMQQQMMMRQQGGQMGEGGDSAAAQQEELDAHAIWEDIVIEIKGRARLVRNRQYYEIQHKWGKTLLHHDEQIKYNWVIEQRKPLVFLKTPTDKFTARKKEKESKAKGKLTADDLKELAEFALTHGLLTQFDETMRDYAKAAPDSEPAKAYKKYLQNDFKARDLPDDPASAWSAKLSSMTRVQSAHYTLLHDIPSSRANAKDAQDVLKMLEDNYRAFFSWFALHGTYVPTPPYRLTVVLADRPDEFANLQKAFDNSTPVASGFHSRRDNLLVMCGTPIDEAYEALEKDTGELWKTKAFDPAECLKGEINKRHSIKDNAYAQTVALLLRAMEEHTARATISNGGTRQLATAVGLLPRTVAAPEWARFGVGSLFETTQDAYWAGTGAPHWTYLMKFKIWKESGKITSPDEELRKVITDANFRATDNGKNKDALLRARTMSWSLCYFLAEKHLPGLMRFSQELSLLPRDMELDEEALTGAFLRAFDVADPARPNDSNNDKFRQLAQEWFAFVSSTVIEVAEVESLAKQKEIVREKRLKAEANPKLAGARPPTMSTQPNQPPQGYQPGMAPPGQGTPPPGGMPRGGPRGRRPGR